MWDENRFMSDDVFDPDHDHDHDNDHEFARDPEYDRELAEFVRDRDHGFSSNHGVARDRLVVMGSNHATPNNLDELIGNYISSPSPMFFATGRLVKELPDIFNGFDTIIHMVLRDCQLEHTTNLPPNLTTLDLSTNRLVTLKGIPTSIQKLVLSANLINDIDLSTLQCLKSITLQSNPLKGTVVFPMCVETLDVSTSYMRDTSPINGLDRLKTLCIDATMICNIIGLPDSIETLNASNIRIGESDGEVHRLPARLVRFTAHASGIRCFKFGAFPRSLKNLDLYMNEITRLPILPDTILTVDVSRNQLEYVANIPLYVRCYECNDNTKLVLTPEQQQTINGLRQQGTVVSINERGNGLGNGLGNMLGNGLGNGLGNMLGNDGNDAGDEIGINGSDSSDGYGWGENQEWFDRQRDTANQRTGEPDIRDAMGINDIIDGSLKSPCLPRQNTRVRLSDMTSQTNPMIRPRPTIASHSPEFTQRRLFGFTDRNQQFPVFPVHQMPSHQSHQMPSHQMPSHQMPSHQLPPRLPPYVQRLIRPDNHTATRDRKVPHLTRCTV